jgi:hypothetical protein
LSCCDCICQLFRPTGGAWNVNPFEVQFTEVANEDLAAGGADTPGAKSGTPKLKGKKPHIFPAGKVGELANVG